MAVEKLHFENRSHKHNCGDEPTAPGFFGYKNGAFWTCTECGKLYIFSAKRKGWYHFPDDKPSVWTRLIDSIRRMFRV